MGQIVENQTLSEHELCPNDLLADQEAAFARDIARLHARGDMVRVPCPACAADRPDSTFEKFGFHFVRCPDCRTLYMNPRPSEASMAAYYAQSENYAYWAKHIFPATEAARRDKIHRPALDRVVGYCEHHGVPRGTLVEVGPGFGTFAALATAEQAFRKVVVIEPTPELAAACRARGVQVIQRRVEDAAGVVDRTDVACAFEVIEHLFEPRRFITAMHALLAPGGLLILSCPNGEGFDIATLGAGSLAVDAEHVNLFNPGSLSHLARSAGFEVLTTHTPGRLDAEFVREAALRKEITLTPFLERVLITEWDRLGSVFQQFLAQHGLSSHMWLVARRTLAHPS
jgi:SAM-dependent methyltransferase